MLLTMLKAKIHRATVTDCDPDYEGSIAIDAGLLAACGILPNEQVDVYNITNGERLTTYAIVAPEGSGTIGLNGAAARKALKGDKIIIAAYAQMDEAAARTHRPVVLLMDERNRVKAG